MITDHHPRYLNPRLFFALSRTNGYVILRPSKLCLFMFSQRNEGMNLELAGQVAVVLGAASGIGRAIAQAFIQEGAKVALLDRAASITDVAQQMEGAPNGQALGIVADVTDYAAIQQAAAQIEQSLGPV